MKKIIFGICFVAIGVLATLGVVHRAKIGDWFKKTFTPTTQVEQVEDEETEETENNTESTEQN